MKVLMHEVGMWDDHSNLVFSGTFTCEPAEVLIENLEAEQLSIWVFGMDKDKNRLFMGNVLLETVHGEQKEIDVPLVLCDSDKVFCY
jgi:hypothetical protein